MKDFGDILKHVQEYIKRGQRVEEFSLEYKEGAEWKEAAKGTTVGFKRLLAFPEVTAKEVRLNISSSKLNTLISDISLFRQ